MTNAVDTGPEPVVSNEVTLRRRIAAQKNFINTGKANFSEVTSTGYSSTGLSVDEQKALGGRADGKLGFEDVAPDALDVMLRNSVTGRVGRARGGSSRSAMGGLFNASKPILGGK
jgi:hypothetical protein